MSSVTEPGLHLRGQEPLPLVEQFFLLRSSREEETETTREREREGEREASCTCSRETVRFTTRRLASFPDPSSDAAGVEGVSSKMRETLPKLYEYECNRRISLNGWKGKLFLPLTVTDELGQRWIAYSLLAPIERDGGEAGAGEGEERERELLILVALSRLHRCFSGMCTLLEIILEACVRDDGPLQQSEAAKLMSWFANLAPLPLPGLAYQVVVTSAADQTSYRERRQIEFSNFAPSNMLPWASEVHFYKLIQVLGIHGLFKLWIAALLEQRILLVTIKEGPLAASYLTVCAETLLMLLEPMKWLGIYVPFVPNSMSVLVEAPTPYLMGISEVGFRRAELDDGIVEVNIDNGRICLPSNLPSIPESLESKLDMIDNTLQDPLQHGFSCGSDGLRYSMSEIQGLLFQIRKSFGTILVDIVENTKQLSHNGKRSLEEIRIASRRFSALDYSSSVKTAGMNLGGSSSSRDLSPAEDKVQLTKGFSFSQTPDASSAKKKLFMHRRSVSWDYMKFQQASHYNAKQSDPNVKLDFIPDTESYEESLYFYEEFFQTQIFQEFLTSGWPPNWPSCVQWDQEEMEKRHSANRSSLSFHLDMAAFQRDPNGFTSEGEQFERVEGVFKRAVEMDSQSSSSLHEDALNARIFVSSGAGDEIQNEILSGPQASTSGYPIELPDTDIGEPIAIFASFVERYIMLQPKNDMLSPLKPAGTPTNCDDGVLRKHSLNKKYEVIHYYEKALEIGVQTYSCIPMARFYRSLKYLEQSTREKVESSLGPNLCMLLEQVRLSDRDSSDEGVFDAGGMSKGEDDSEEELCVTLTATAAHDLSSLKLSQNQKPLNLINMRHHGNGEEGRPLKQPEEIILVCVSTVKMLLTIQANKNNNKVRQYIDANDIVEVAESPEYMYFSEATSELSQVDPSTLSQKQRAVFFINLYNLMILHGALEKARNRKESDSRMRWLPSASPFGWMKFLRNATYNVGGQIYSALDVEHSILRSTRPYNDNLFIGRLLPYFKSGDPRLRCKVNQQIPLLTFALCPGTMCSPPFKCFHEYDFENEVSESETISHFFFSLSVKALTLRFPLNPLPKLVSSAKTFLLKYCNAVSRNRKVLEVRLPLLLKWYRHDLGHGDVGLSHPNKWLISIAHLIKGTKVSTCILDAIDAKLPITIKYETYKWELGWMLQES